MAIREGPFVRRPFERGYRAGTFIGAASVGRGERVVTDERPTSEAVEATTSSAEMAATVEGGSAPADERSTGSEWLPVRSLRVAISLVAVFGYAILFGAGVGTVGATLESLGGALGHDRIRRLYIGGALALPAATFLFVALYDDADLTLPEWPDGHPPLWDAWLLVLATSGAVTVALSTSAWPELVGLVGWAAAAVACLALPFWLARRCLRRPSWTLGGLGLLTAPLVVVAAFLAVAVLEDAGPAFSAVTALVGFTVPYGLAYASPGPHRLAHRLGGALGRAGAALRVGSGKLLRRWAE